MPPLSPVVILLWLAAGPTVRVDQYPLRSGCEAGGREVTRLSVGQPVTIKLSLSLGTTPCYLIRVASNGQEVEGYVAADALDGLEEFEQARRTAAPVIAGTAPAAPAPKALPPPSVRVPAHPDIDRAMDLLSRQQPEQALALLTRLIAAHPKEPGLLAMAGHAAERADRPLDAIEFWTRAIALRADPELEKRIEEVRRSAAADRSVERKYGTRFLLRYDGAVVDSPTASQIVALLEEEFSRVSAQLGCRADERIVTIVQTREAYLRATNAAEWSAAAYDGRIRVPLPDRSQVTPELRRTFGHEIVHACLASLGRWPTWLHEGLAQRLSGETLTARDREIVAAASRAGRMPKLELLGRGWTGLDAASARFAYVLAHRAVELFF
ncbi:MAG: hypothetical protein IPM24_17065 [Bryobacterales bacterium]|nr:hypothetical protein [Bryobacterales bacterium]